MTEKCAVYISSWDGYSDLWEPMVKIFYKHWADCPFNVFMGANQKTYSYNGAKTLQAPEGSNWTDRAKIHLDQIDAEYILMFLEDWFLTDKVDNDLINSLLLQMDILEGKMLRLVPDAKPQKPVAGYPDIGILTVGQLNRTNTHATIWRKDTLLDLMRAGESLWEFEVNGSIRSNKYSGGMFAVWNRAVKYNGVVDRALWWPGYARRYASMDVGCDFNKRGIMTRGQAFKWYLLKHASWYSRYFIPFRMRQKLKQWIFGENVYQFRQK